MTAKLREQRFMEGVLANVGLFAGVPDADLVAVARQASVLAARRGDLLLTSGAPLPGVFVVGYGLAKLALRSPDGREHVLRIVGGGQTFGAASALLGRGSRYEARALVDSMLVVVPSCAIDAAMDREPRFARNVLQALAQRVLDLNAELEAVSLQSSGQRLGSYLASLVPLRHESGVLTVRLPVSKTLIAARLGMKKETLSRLLHRLVAEGLIEVSRCEIRIRDREALACLTRA